MNRLRLNEEPSTYSEISLPIFSREEEEKLRNAEGSIKKVFEKSVLFNFIQVLRAPIN